MRQAPLPLKGQIEHARRFESALDDLAESDRRAAAGGVDDAANRRIAPAQEQRTAAPQPCGSVAIDDDAGELRQSRLDGQQGVADAAFGLDRLKTECVILDERTNAGASQCADMTEAAEQPPQITRDGAHIGALAAIHL